MTTRRKIVEVVHELVAHSSAHRVPVGDGKPDAKANVEFGMQAVAEARARTS